MIVREMLKPPRSIVDSKIMLVLMAISHVLLWRFEPVMPEDILYHEIWPHPFEMLWDDSMLIQGLAATCTLILKREPTLGCLKTATKSPTMIILGYAKPEEIPDMFEAVMPEQYRGMLLDLKLER